MAEFDKLWNYNNPAETETKFREALKEYTREKNEGLYLELLTQIARTYGLRRMFDEAHKLLDEVHPLLPPHPSIEGTRYHLERGRTFNSSNKRQEAIREFQAARKMAEEIKDDYYTIDAVHMLAIAAPNDEAIRLNEEGVLLLENSTQDRAKNWLGALYNNLGWGYFDKGEYEKALSIFLRALKWRLDYAEKTGKEPGADVFIAKWCVARALRALNRLDEALKIQLGLLEEMVKADTPDGYVYEELGELYLAKGEEVSKMYFGFAYNLLSKDSWLVEKEQARILRIKDLSV